MEAQNTSRDIFFRGLPQVLNPVGNSHPDDSISLDAPLMRDGNISNDIWDILRETWEPNNRLWDAKELKPVLSNIWFQQKQMGIRFRTRVIVTALFNLHKKMKAYSYRGLHLLDEEFSVWNDFYSLLNPVLNREMAFEEQEGETGRQTDQRFIEDLQTRLIDSGIEGSTTKWHAWHQGVQPRNARGWMGRNAAQGRPCQYLPTAELHTFPTTVPEIQDGEWNQVVVAAKPPTNLEPHLWP